MRIHMYTVLLIASLLSAGQGFAPLSGQRVSFNLRESTAKISSRTQLHFFFRNKEDEKDGEKINHDEANNEEDKGKAPFLSFLRPNTQQEDQQVEVVDAKADATTPSPRVAVATVDPPDQHNADDSSSPAPPPVNKEEPVDKIAALRAQADRVRLEAEKLDAELTLAKITRLEKEVAKAQRKGESTEDLFRKMDNLQRKMRGEPIEPAVYTATTKASTTNTSDSSSTLEIGTTTTATARSGPLTAPPSEPLAPFSQDEFDRCLRDFNDYPAFLKVIMARSVGMQPMSARDVNATEYALRSEKQLRLDFSFVKDIPPPQFTEAEIETFKKSFKLVDWREKFSEAYEINELTDDDLILQAMKEEYYYTNISEQYGVSKGMAQGVLSGNIDDAEKFAAAIEIELNRSQPYQTIESIFPKCVQKEGQIPTKAQIKMLMSDVLPKAGFNFNSEPIEVYGGYLIRGDTKKEKGDDLIDSIDALVNKNPMLKGKFTITYLKDLSGMLNLREDELEQVLFGSGQPRALYVMGPNVSRERNRLLATATSALGIGTCWYLSIYPFLLNANLMKRAEEQMLLADASMAYDLGWLTDLSFPLFVSFLSLQFAHEAGHKVVAAAYGMNITFPTFVPSLASGITSSITDLKDPPKNREQLFDFAIAGPLTGIIASMIALYAGLQLTVNSDASALATFPALPLEILRQSSLGGGFIENILGNGVLSIPEGARGTQAVSSINIPLHPVAIAGYISLIVNSLSLLPIGVTDGGRISQAIFNRAGKQIVGQLFLLGVFAVGIFGDDLFLFYAFFCSFFAQGSEIPQRNEVDEISYSRVLLATTAGVVALLSIIPMQ